MRHLVVGGAGIGGLTAAIAMARGGERVTLFERRSVLADYGAGIQVAPNATRVLDRLGLLGPVRAEATVPAAIRIRRARDGAALATMALTEAESRYGAPFLLLHRADLQRVLATEAQALEAVDLRLGMTIDRVVPGSGGVSVALLDKREMTADGFIDARGVRTRLGPGPGGAQPKLTAWRALVPAGALPAAYTKAETNLWLGPSTHLVHYPLRRGTLVNVVAITPRAQPTASGEDALWSQTGDPALLRRHFHGWHRDATVLLDGPVEWRCWPLFDAPALDSWGTGPVTRLGDAAHPMLPFLAQGASQGVEDAGALAAALAQSPDVAAAFRRYEQRRAPRAARVQRASRRQGELYHLSRPASDARDLVMRALGERRALASMDWLYRPA